MAVRGAQLGGVKVLDIRPLRRSLRRRLRRFRHEEREPRGSTRLIKETVN